MAYSSKIRFQRLRHNSSLREMVQESRLSIKDFIYPIFVTHGRGVRNPIGHMPGMHQLSLDNLISEIGEVRDLGIPGVLLFGIPEEKDQLGTEAYTSGGIIQEAIRVIKETVPELLVVTDVCLCEYTIDGHCGLVGNGKLDSGRTIELLTKIALCQAEAGSDIIAPSAMMGGQVAPIRAALDAHGLMDTPIMSYSARYGSAFYRPFRIAAASEPASEDRVSYQMDPANSRTAIREIEQDIEEGADIVMVKPALAYLDVLSAAKNAFVCPIAAFNVSGEYAMVKAASEKEWLGGRQLTIEILTSIKRAGADIIISYHSKEIAGWLSA